MPIGLQVPTLHAGVHAVALTITLHQRFGQPLGLGFIGSTPHEQRRAPVEQLYLAGVPRAAVRPAIAVGVGGCIVRRLGVGLLAGAIEFFTMPLGVR